MRDRSCRRQLLVRRTSDHARPPHSKPSGPSTTARRRAADSSVMSSAKMRSASRAMSGSTGDGVGKGASPASPVSPGARSAVTPASSDGPVASSVGDVASPAPRAGDGGDAGDGGLPGTQNGRVGTPSRALTHPSSSCTTDRALRSWRCRGVRHLRRAARRDRRSGRWRDGHRAGSPDTSSRADHAMPGALGHSGAATPACCTGRCGGCGSTAGRARCSELPGRLVTTPQTVQSFIDQHALARAPSRRV